VGIEAVLGAMREELAQEPLLAEWDTVYKMQVLRLRRLQGTQTSSAQDGGTQSFFIFFSI